MWEIVWCNFCGAHPTRRMSEFLSSPILPRSATVFIPAREEAVAISNRARPQVNDDLHTWGSKSPRRFQRDMGKRKPGVTVACIGGPLGGVALRGLEG
jgi:hypothetical protein